MILQFYYDTDSIVVTVKTIYDDLDLSFVLTRLTLEMYTYDIFLWILEWYECFIQCIREV